MKKILITILSVLLLFSSFTIQVFADDYATISEDLQELTINGMTYTRIDASLLDVEYFNELDTEVRLSASQQNSIKDIYLETGSSEIYIYAQITNVDGSILALFFIQNDYLDDYYLITGEKNQDYTIDFEWPTGNTVDAKRTELFGSSTVLDEYELSISDYFYVSAQNDEETLTAITGSLLIVDEDFYYIDFKEASIYDWYEFEPYDFSELPAHHITKESLIAELQDAENAYYEDDMGFMFDDDFGHTLSAIFLIILFAVIPLIIFILFLIFAIRSKTGYKKIFRTIWILSAAELIIFAVVTILIIIF